MHAMEGELGVLGENEVTWQVRREGDWRVELMRER